MPGPPPSQRLLTSATCRIGAQTLSPNAATTMSIDGRIPAWMLAPRAVRYPFLTDPPQRL
ncbi:hypothetical protein [Salinicola halophilus]|uniref:hypothetical protein n=1 Tax=Salinicola halophilus TaxID=184065 RepID=UPI0013A5F97A|nr:hypothetical protein [Salinicola halophilus]